MAIKCVLLIDDDRITNFVNKQLLKKYFEPEVIEISTNGVVALDYLQDYAKQNNNFCPNVIFVDLNMPLLDGFGFLEQYNKIDFCNKDEVQIVVLTTSTHPKDLEKLNSFSNIEYLVKPLNKEKLDHLRSKLKV